MAEAGENKVELKVVTPKPVDFSFRMAILVLLAAQNAAHALMSRYSKVLAAKAVFIIAAEVGQFKLPGNFKRILFQHGSCIGRRIHQVVRRRLSIRSRYSRYRYKLSNLICMLSVPASVSKILLYHHGSWHT